MSKPLPILLLLLPFFISCTRYQYSTVSSSQLDKNETNELVFENDTLKLVYNFLGPDLGPTIYIENKSAERIYIDWRESALIVNGGTHAYAPIQVELNGIANGDATLPIVDFIPPHGALKRTPLVLTQYYSASIAATKFQKARYTAAGRSHSVKTALFTEATSPLQFRSFISYKMGSLTREPLNLSVENSFYVSGIMNTRAGPLAIMRNGNHGNQFYSSRSTNTSATAQAVALAGELLGTIVIATGGILLGFAELIR